MSDILIKGMEMPKGCASCFLKYGSCASIRKRMDASKGDRWCPENYRHPDCPLAHVPPHGELIEKGTLLDKCYQHYEDFMRGKVDGKTALLNIEKEIKAAPTVIPADKGGAT